MPSTRSLSFARSALLTVDTYDLIDDVEFALLYGVNKSREVYPHWKFNQFVWNAIAAISYHKTLYDANLIV